MTSTSVLVNEKLTYVTVVESSTVTGRKEVLMNSVDLEMYGS